MQIVLEVLYWLVRCSSGGGSYAQAIQQQMHCFHSCYLLTFITFNYAAIQAFRNGGRFQPSNRGGHVQLRKKHTFNSIGLRVCFVWVNELLLEFLFFFRMWRTKAIGLAALYCDHQVPLSIKWIEQNAIKSSKTMLLRTKTWWYFWRCMKHNRCRTRCSQ